MFTHVPQPLRYAEALLTHFASLSRTGREPALQERFVQAVAELSGCELSQLYLLDATHTSLSLAAEWLGGALQPRAAASVPVDYNGEQLLQFALCKIEGFVFLLQLLLLLLMLLQQPPHFLLLLLCSSCCFPRTLNFFAVPPMPLQCTAISSSSSKTAAAAAAAGRQQ